MLLVTVPAGEVITGEGLGAVGVRLTFSSC